MITRRDAQQVVESLRELEWGEIVHHPEDVLWHRWDYRHYHRLRDLAERGAWGALVTALRSCGETHVRESVETLIKRRSPRWYRHYLAR